jgi:hypothetical protein
VSTRSLALTLPTSAWTIKLELRKEPEMAYQSVARKLHCIHLTFPVELILSRQCIKHAL